jgi:hypothetical protein
MPDNYSYTHTWLCCFLVLQRRVAGFVVDEQYLDADTDRSRAFLDRMSNTYHTHEDPQAIMQETWKEVEEESNERNTETQA